MGNVRGAQGYCGYLRRRRETRDINATAAAAMTQVDGSGTAAVAKVRPIQVI